jgi:hypothetical protein
MMHASRLAHVVAMSAAPSPSDAFVREAMQQHGARMAQLLRDHPAVAHAPLPAPMEPTLALHAAWLARVHAVVPAASPLGLVLAHLRSPGAATAVGASLLQSLAAAMECSEAAAAAGADFHAVGRAGLTAAQVVGVGAARASFAIGEIFPGTPCINTRSEEGSQRAADERYTHVSPGTAGDVFHDAVSRAHWAMRSGQMPVLPGWEDAVTRPHAPPFEAETAAFAAALHGSGVPGAAAAGLPHPGAHGEAVGLAWLAAVGRGAWVRRRAVVVGAAGRE